jgi:hypothetical protein
MDKSPMHSDVERLRYERKREKGLVKIGVTVGVGSHGFEWTKDRTGPNIAVL